MQAEQEHQAVVLGDVDLAVEVRGVELTVERESRRKFLEGRQRGIGSTDVYRILTGDALGVYHEKTRPVTDADVVEGENAIDLMRGRMLEALAAASYRNVTGRRVRRRFGQLFHPDFPGAMTSADGDIFEDASRPEWQRGTGGLELKCPRGSVIQGLIEHGTRESILYQGQHSVAVRRLTWGSYGFFTLEHSAGPIIPVDFAADPAVGGFLLEISARFWVEHVVPRVPPDDDSWAKLYEKGPKVVEGDGELRVLSPDVHGVGVALIERLCEVQRLKKEVETAKDEVSARLDAWLIEQFGSEAAKFQAPGVGKVTRVSSARRTFDPKALRAAQPIDRDAFVRWCRDHPEVADSDFVGDTGAEAIADDLALDVERFNRMGAPFSYLLTTPARGEA